MVRLLVGMSVIGLGMSLLGCSTTKHLPEGEVLYTGVKYIHEQEEDPPVEKSAKEAVRP